MKMKFLLTMISILFVSVFSTYASFPVERATPSSNNVTTLVEKSTDDLSSPAADTTSSKSQLIALVLVLFAGGISAHRFYLGYIGSAVLQIITFGGCGIWWLIDAIRIATGDLKPKGGSYKTTL